MAVENGSAGVFTDSYLTSVGTNKPSVMWCFDFPVFYDPSLVRAVMIRTEEKVNEIKQKEGNFERKKDEFLTWLQAVHKAFLYLYRK